jgi:hypothetical protein
LQCHMPIDIQSEQVITFAQATEHLPRVRRGKKLNIATLYRWARSGRRGVILESIPIGGTLCTSLEALQRFFDELGSMRREVRPSTGPPRARTSARDRETLRRAGITETPERRARGASDSGRAASGGAGAKPSRHSTPRSRRAGGKSELP